MPAQPKILLVDDDQDFLDLYQEMLCQHLPSLPTVRTANSGARALSLLESEDFSLFIIDLNMPKMDGLQVISVVRRKYPELRLVALTALREEQFRTRAYALGIDQYWIKPESDQELGLFMESLESLITRESNGGFRGVQSKSMVDIIQLECLSQNSCVLKITNGPADGKIWVQNGEVYDAEAAGLSAEPAFQRILSWKTGSFEVLPADSERPRTIFTSYQGLLLNTAQVLDEAASQEETVSSRTGAHTATSSDIAAMLAEVSQMNGVEFVLAVTREEKPQHDFWGLENPRPMAEFTRQTLENFRMLGERLQVGQLQQVFGTGPQRKVAAAPCGKADVCVGFPPSYSAEQLRDTLKSILTKWAS
jgi:CheY-like chemotaxis protein